jgi:hypothetical protein
MHLGDTVTVDDVLICGTGGVVMLRRNPTPGKQEMNLVPPAHCLVSSDYEY